MPRGQTVISTNNLAILTLLAICNCYAQTGPKNISNKKMLSLSTSTGSTTLSRFGYLTFQEAITSNKNNVLQNSHTS